MGQQSPDADAQSSSADEPGGDSPAGAAGAGGESSADTSQQTPGDAGPGASGAAQSPEAAAAIEAAIQAALNLREQYPLQSRVVRKGWYTTIEVVETDGYATSPCLYAY